MVAKGALIASKTFVTTYAMHCRMTWAMDSAIMSESQVATTGTTTAKSEMTQESMSKLQSAMETTSALYALYQTMI